MPEKEWDYTYSIKMVQQLMGGRLYPLTLEGLDCAMRGLVREADGPSDAVITYGFLLIDLVGQPLERHQCAFGRPGPYCAHASRKNKHCGRV